MVSLSLQAGGHQDGFSTDSDDLTRVLKRTNKRELEFYETFCHQLDQQQTQSSSTSSGQRFIDTIEWRPKYYGQQGDHQDDLGRVTIILENLTNLVRINETQGARVEERMFQSPNLMDLKLGQVLYDQLASEEKVQRMIKAASDTTSANFGIRLTGGMNYDNQTREYQTIPKTFGKSLSPDGSDLNRGFNSFFPIRPDERTSNTSKECGAADNNLVYSAGGLSIEYMEKLLKRYIRPKLIKLVDYVSNFRWKVFGSSILIVYEGNQEALKRKLLEMDHNPNSSSDHICLVRMIDFAHAWPSDEVDNGLRLGFKTSIRLFDDLLSTIEKVSHKNVTSD
ncbi:hypothetical protein BY996DRAFT_8519603 [Phakopsora pachyrhizi]|nr:hypothetical protein BY996DRAFT_8519603 [Phakopsora pachyrhizi]